VTEAMHVAVDAVVDGRGSMQQVLRRAVSDVVGPTQVDETAASASRWTTVP